MARVAAGLALLLMVPLAVQPVQADGCPAGDRIVIDASKARGVWWGPPSGPEHQGHKLAEFLRARGSTVIELPVGMSVSSSTFACADLVVRVHERDQSPSEVAAYVAFVEDGGQLLLLSEHRKHLKGDALASAFGVEVNGAGAPREEVELAPGSVAVAADANGNVKARVAEGRTLSWIGGACADSLPPGAQVLARSRPGTLCDRDGDGILEPDEAKGSVVGARFFRGAGRVDWYSDVNAFQQVGEPRMAAYLAEMASSFGV